MKRILITLLFATILQSFLVHADEVNGINYRFTPDGCAEVTSKDPNYSGDIVIPDTVKLFGRDYRVTSIASSAFEASSITSITFPNTITSIGRSAFSFCTSLKSVKLPESLKILEMSVFTDCSALSEITIPKLITSLGWAAFYGTPWYEKKPNGLLYFENILIEYKGDKSTLVNLDIKDGTEIIAHGAFSGCVNLSHITLPTTLTNIDHYAFSSCPGITNISIPESVTRIGTGAFSECTGLTTIVLPNKLKTVDDFVFKACSNMNTVTFPANLECIGNNAFESCAKLSGITFPNTMKYIGSYAFSGCTILNSAILPNSITEIGANTFSSCSSLSTLILPDKLKSIPAYAFSGCSNLNTVTIPDSVKSIYGYAFLGCTGLKSIYIRSDETTIQFRAFGNCTSLKLFSIASPNPPSINSYTFQNVDKQSCILEVPVGASTAYKANTYWKDFGSINEVNFNTITPEYTENKLKVYALDNKLVIEGTNNNELIQIYSISGILIQSKKSQGGKLIFPASANTFYLIKSKYKTYKLTLQH